LKRWNRAKKEAPQGYRQATQTLQRRRYL
jgi:hypothetical protein